MYGLGLCKYTVKYYYIIYNIQGGFNIWFSPYMGIHSIAR